MRSVRKRWILAVAVTALLAAAVRVGPWRVSSPASESAAPTVTTSRPASPGRIRRASIAAAPRRASVAAVRAPASPSPSRATFAATPGAIPAASGTVTCQPAPANDYATCRYVEPSGDGMTFYLFVPSNYDPTRTYPLVLLLHGGGERARPTKTAAQNRDLLLNQPYVAVWGPGYPHPDAPDVQRRWPSFVVVPQLLAGQRWVNVPPATGSYHLAAQPSDPLRMAMEILDVVQARYTGIDPSRRYITGLSLGGYGTWEAIERWPGYFAAAAPICGAGDPSQAARIKDLPIWAFHGSADPTVPVSGSRDMVHAIEAAGGHARYTEYSGAGHAVWTNVYALLGRPSPTPGFFNWLFAQRRAGTAA
ncbi:MAG TPA: alpha/beta hydrolase-fold protein [Thermomicrobiaceae bacterium]|nr:alpha/beta hydrolase-fold protein [Thermomicrobiaceae bacterium]